MTANEQLAGLRVRVEAVRALHKRVMASERAVCGECWVEWPCPTIKALDGQSC